MSNLVKETNIINIIQDKLGRNLSIDEIIKISNIYKKIEAKIKNINSEIINKIGDFLIEEYFVDDMINILHKFMYDEINKSDNTTYLIDKQKIDQLSKEISLDLNKAINKVSHKLEKNVLFPNYVRQYIIFDTLYLDWLNETNPNPTYFIRDEITEFTIKPKLLWNLSVNYDSSSNDNIIKLKYPLKNIISMQILPFYIPPYIIKTDGGEWLETFNVLNCPYNKNVSILIDEIIEKFYTNNQNKYDNYTTISDAQFIKKKFNPIYETIITEILPINQGNIIFRYPIQELTKISISLRDLSINQQMLFPTPILYIGFWQFNSNIFIGYLYWWNASWGSLLQSGQLGIISGFNFSVNRQYYINTINYINRPEGHIIYLYNTPRDLSWSQWFYFIFDPPQILPFGPTFGSFDFKKCSLYIPSRRMQIPMIFNQLREYN